MPGPQNERHGPGNGFPGAVAPRSPFGLRCRPWPEDRQAAPGTGQDRPKQGGKSKQIAPLKHLPWDRISLGGNTFRRLGPAETLGPPGTITSSKHGANTRIRTDSGNPQKHYPKPDNQVSETHNKTCLFSRQPARL